MTKDELVATSSDIFKVQRAKGVSAKIIIPMEKVHHIDSDLPEQDTVTIYFEINPKTMKRQFILVDNNDHTILIMKGYVIIEV